MAALEQKRKKQSNCLNSATLHKDSIKCYIATSVRSSGQTFLFLLGQPVSVSSIPDEIYIKSYVSAYSYKQHIQQIPIWSSG